jgi:hypothetical protein
MDDDWGGIYCRPDFGPSFGLAELHTYSPLIGEENVISHVVKYGFMIGDKDGDINPLTGDTIIENSDNYLSGSTAVEIEVW